MGRRRSIANAKDSSTPGKGFASSAVRKPRGRPRTSNDMNAEVRDLHLKESKADEAMEAKGSTEPSIDEPASDTEIANHTGVSADIHELITSILNAPKTDETMEAKGSTEPSIDERESSTPGDGAASYAVRKPRGRPRKAKETHMDGSDASNGHASAAALSDPIVEERSKQYGIHYDCKIKLQDFLKMKGIRRCGLRPLNHNRVQNMVNEFTSEKQPNGVISMWNSSSPAIAVTNSAFQSAFTVTLENTLCKPNEESAAFASVKCLLLEGNHRFATTEKIAHQITDVVMNEPINVKVVVVPKADDASLELSLNGDTAIAVAGKLPAVSRACCLLSMEFDRNEFFKRENEKRSFFETVIHCRDMLIPYIRSIAPRVKNRNLKSVAVNEGLLTAQKSDRLNPCEPWNFAIDFNYQIPPALFELLEDVMYTSAWNVDRRNQPFDRQTTLIFKHSWELSEDVVRDALRKLGTLEEKYPVLQFNRILRRVFIVEFMEYMKCARCAEDDKMKIRVHMYEMNSILREDEERAKVKERERRSRRTGTGQEQQEEQDEQKTLKKPVMVLGLEISSIEMENPNGKGDDDEHMRGGKRHRKMPKANDTVEENSQDVTVGHFSTDSIDSKASQKRPSDAHAAQNALADTVYSTADASESAVLKQQRTADAVDDAEVQEHEDETMQSEVRMQEKPTYAFESTLTSRPRRAAASGSTPRQIAQSLEKVNQRISKKEYVANRAADTVDDKSEEVDVEVPEQFDENREEQMEQDARKRSDNTRNYSCSEISKWPNLMEKLRSKWKEQAEAFESAKLHIMSVEVLSSVHVDVDMIQFAHAVLKWGGFIHIRSANNKNKRSTFGLFDGEEVHENIVFEGMDVRRVYVALHKDNSGRCHEGLLFATADTMESIMRRQTAEPRDYSNTMPATVVQWLGVHKIYFRDEDVYTFNPYDH